MPPELLDPDLEAELDFDVVVELLVDVDTDLDEDPDFSVVELLLTGVLIFLPEPELVVDTFELLDEGEVETLLDPELTDLDFKLSPLSI